MINLIPTQLKEARRYGRRNRIMIGYCLAILATGFITIAITFINMQYANNDVSRLQKEMKSRESEAAKLEAGQKEVESIAGQLKTIDKLYSGEVKFSELVPKIGGLLPRGMVLNALSLTGGKSSPLQLDVDMESQELVAIFQQNLVNSDLFDAADIAVITSKGGSAPKPGQKSYPYGATLTASFKGAPKKPATGVKQ